MGYSFPYNYATNPVVAMLQKHQGALKQIYTNTTASYKTQHFDIDYGFELRCIRFAKFILLKDYCFHTLNITMKVLLLDQVILGELLAL